MTMTTVRRRKKRRKRRRTRRRKRDLSLFPTSFACFDSSMNGSVNLLVEWTGQ